MEDKAFPGLFVCSPVSGKVQRIQRGPKRVLEAIVLEADAETRYQDFGSAKPAELDPEAIRAKMMNSGSGLTCVKGPTTAWPGRMPNHDAS